VKDGGFDAPDLGFDLDDLGVAGIVLAVIALLFVLPILIAVVLFSFELALVLLLVPFAMIGQLVGWLPWVLVLRTPNGQKRYVSVSGTRKMLEARSYYRSLRVS
jgi:hypothetical protein